MPGVSSSSLVSVAIKRIISLVVHHKNIIYKVEAVGASLEGCSHHLLCQLLVNAWKLVNMFTGVDAVWNAESKVKIKCLEVSVSEKVSLDHPEVLQWLVSNFELYCGPNVSKFEKLKYFSIIFLSYFVSKS